MAEVWKSNWEETKQHFIDWWNRKGLVLDAGTVPAAKPHDDVEDPGPRPDDWHLQPEWFAKASRYGISLRDYIGDSVPTATINTGPGALSTLLGAEPVFEPGTVWYKPCITDPETHPPLKFDREQKWWKIHEALFRRCAELSEGNYYVGCVDWIENYDTYCQVRDNQTALTDLFDRPQFVKDKIDEINEAFFAAFDAFHEICAHPDGSCVFWAFGMWSPGKVAKVQCDAAAMLSPEMFREFVVPALSRQCDWLDHSMFHLDGHQCIVHLDALFEIESLDAIEWTPDPKVPDGGDPHWYDMYRRIKEAGKSVQAIHIRPEEVAPLLDAVGPEGMYLAMGDLGGTSPEEVVRTVEKYRG